MARIGDVGELAPAVGDLLVLDQRVHDQGEQPDIGAERLGQRGGGGFAHAAVGILQLAEQRLEGQLLALEGKPQRGDRLVEQPVPRRGARHRLFEEQLLELVAELVRPLLADVDQPRTIMGERRILRRRVEPGVVEPIEFELEEQQLAGELGHLLLRVAEELGARRIAGVAGVKQRSVGHDAAHQVLQLFVGADRLEQARPASAPSASSASLP